MINKPIIFLFLLLLVLSSCCRNCIITNRELSSFKVYKDDKRKTVVRIESNSKLAEIAASGKGEILSYTGRGDNIFAKIYPFFIIKTYIVNHSNPKRVLYSDVQAGIINPDKIILSAIGKEPLDYVKEVREVQMNLDNGSLSIGTKIYNESNLPIRVFLNSELFLKKGGFLIIPLNIISKMKPDGWRYIGKNKKTNFIEKNIHKYGNTLFVHALSGIKFETDFNQNWIIYIKDDLLFIQKRQKISENSFPIVKVTVNDYVTLSDQKVASIVYPGAFMSEDRDWMLISLDREIKTVEDAYRLYDKVKLKLRLLLNEM